MSYLDLRDLAAEWQDLIDSHDSNVTEQAEDLLEETKKFRALCDELGIDADPDALAWYANSYEPTLIPEYQFEDYARELADDIGAISDEYSWPTSCIDWKKAARELAMDFSGIEYDGKTYLISQ